MRSWFVVSAALLVAFASAEEDEKLPKKTNVKLDKGTTLVLFGTRHGNRNPETFVEVPDRSWGQEGELELTSIGKRQAYGLGKEVRDFIGAKQLIGKNFQPSEAKFYSSSANRCQMTLQSALAGLYDPSGYADWNKKNFEHWSPVPYSIDDPLLRMYSVKGCVNSDKAWEPVSKDTLPDLVELANKSKPLLDYIAKNEPKRKGSISDAADVADNILQMDFYKAKYPDWLAKPTLAGYDAKSIKAAYLNFVEAHTIRCANHAPCRDLMGGLWLQHILSSFDSAAQGKGPKLIGYASHTEVTLSLMKLMGIDKKELTTSAGFVFEFKKDKDSGLVRLLNHDPNPIDEHVIYKSKLEPELAKSANSDGWIPLDKLKEFTKKRIITDWQAACGIDLCPTKKL